MRHVKRFIALTLMAVIACGSTPAGLSVDPPAFAVTANPFGPVTIAQLDGDSVDAVTSWPPTVKNTHKLDHYRVEITRESDGQLLLSAIVRRPVDAPQMLPDTTLKFRLPADTVEVPTQVCVWAEDARGNFQRFENPQCRPWVIPAVLVLPGPPGVPTTDTTTVPDPVPPPAPPPPPPPPPVGDTHEPAGTTTIVGFTTLSSPVLPAPPNGGQWTSDWARGDAPTPANVSVVDGALRMTYPQGMTDGKGPARARMEFGPRFPAYYAGVDIRFSQPWQHHPILTKLFYASSQERHDAWYLGVRSDGLVHATLQLSQGYDTPCGVSSERNVPACIGFLSRTRVDDGQWHRVEVLAEGNTGANVDGRMRVWVDGILQWEVAARFAMTDAEHGNINVDPVWGGVAGAVVQRTQFLEFRNLRVSGR